MQIDTARCQLTIARPADAVALSRYYQRNAAHLARWEPARPEGFHDPAQWHARLVVQQDEIAAGRLLPLVARLAGQPSEVVAVANFGNIVTGAFMATHLGYSIDATHEGQGLMHEILDAALSHVFRHMGLHRVMANYLPENTRSAALLERLGFEREGYARSYLKIAGEWRDHVLTSKLNPFEGL